MAGHFSSVCIFFRHRRARTGMRACEGPEFDDEKTEHRNRDNDNGKTYVIMHAKVVGRPRNAQGKAQRYQGGRDEPHIPQAAEGPMECDPAIGYIRKQIGKPEGQDMGGQKLELEFFYCQSQYCAMHQCIDDPDNRKTQKISMLAPRGNLLDPMTSRSM